MSVQAISWVLDYSESRLGARCVLLSIANHAGPSGSGSWPSVKTIAKEARLSEREVQYAKAELKRIGELEEQIGAGPKGVNLYSLPKMGTISTGAKFAPSAQDVVGGCTERPKVVHTGAPEPSKSEPSNSEPPIVPVSVWLDFVKMRNKIRKPLTDRASELIRLELLKFKQRGFDPVEILENSIRNGWQDVYEPREGATNGTSGRNPTKADERRSRTSAALREVLGSPQCESGAVQRNLPPGA